jgi:hypothetical protein
MQTKAGIAIDVWALSIFDRRLSEAGYTYDKGPGLTQDTFFLTVTTDNPVALAHVLRAACIEAFETKGKH